MGEGEQKAEGEGEQEAEGKGTQEGRSANKREQHFKVVMSFYCQLSR